MSQKTKRKKAIVEDTRPTIRVRLDHKTIITVRDMQALSMWKEKYPDLKVLAA
ncbi:MAG: hypothetical protein ACFB10_17515 [Salibacteraceae bacterium]